MDHTRKPRAIYVERIENEQEKTYSIKVHYPDDITMDEMKGTVQREIERNDLLYNIWEALMVRYKRTNVMLIASVTCNALMLMLFYWR